jgi:hypothetical protein
VSNGRKSQNTHWFRAGKGYTSDPRQADPERFSEAGGIHDCFVLQCEVVHANNADEYTAWKLSQRSSGAA